MRSVFAVLAYLVLLALAGCGGSDAASAGVNAQVAPKIVIGWAQRAREVSGPSSAISASILLREPGNNSHDFTFSVNRATSPGSYLQTYTAPGKIPTGVRILRVSFLSDYGGVPAIAEATVRISSTGDLLNLEGLPLGNVLAQGTLKSVSLLLTSTVGVGESIAPVVDGQDSVGNVVALSPGSIFYHTEPGTGSIRIDSSGNVVGVSPGTCTLTCVVDNITSAPQNVTVTSLPLKVSTLVQSVTALALDTRSGHLWASVPGSAATYANSVVEIDPNTQGVISSVQLGSEPTILAISDDGSALYAVLSATQSVARVDPVAKVLVSSFPITTSSTFETPVAWDIAVEPGDADVIALSSNVAVGGSNGGVGIYAKGVELPKTVPTYQNTAVAFTSPSTLWASDPGISPPSVFKTSVDDSQGVSLVGSINGFGGSLRAFAGNLLFHSGQLVSGVDGGVLGTFSLWQSFGSPNFTLDAMAQRAFFLDNGSPDSQNSYLQVFDTGSFKPVSNTQLAVVNTSPFGTFIGPIRYGPQGLAFSDGSKIFFLPQAPGL